MSDPRPSDGPPTDALPASWQAAGDLPNLAMVESSAQLPGLLNLAGWNTVQHADIVVAVDGDTGALPHVLEGDGIDVHRVAPADPGVVVGRDLLGAAPTGNDRLARAVLDVARSHERTALLLPPDDTELARDIALTVTHDADVQVEWVFLAGAPRGLATLRLAETMERLLDPQDGCPWDLQQTHESLAPHLVEETWEVLDAIERGTDEDLAEELGDVLLQVVFHAGVAQARGAFDLDEVAHTIADKLERRHPHVFGHVDVADAKEVEANWEAVKAREKPERTGPFDGIVRAMPSLPLLDKIAGRAARVGWEPSLPEALDMAARAVDAIGTAARAHHDGPDGPAVDPDEVDEAVGQLGIALVAVARACDRDAESVVRGAAAAWIDRFEAAARRDERRQLGSSTTAQWQELLDEVAAAGW